MELELKYGCNPNQQHARLLIQDDPSPLEVLNGSPGYINLLDALRGWQLVTDLESFVGKPAAASFKHVSPAGCAVAGDLSIAMRKSQFLPDDVELSPVASAYVKARSSDRVASFGDFIAVSDTVGTSLAHIIKPEVSDGIIAPDYEDEALDILKQKKKGNYVILRMDRDYQPPAIEHRYEFGITLEQSHNDAVVDRALLSPDRIVTDAKEIDDVAIETALVATIALKHTQSNSVSVGYEGQAIGIGAGQQSRIACTRIACDKAERWFLKLHPKAVQLEFHEGMPRSEKVNAVDQFIRYNELDDSERAQFAERIAGSFEPLTDEERSDWLSSFSGIVLSSDAFFPFRDNLDRAAKSGASIVVQPGGSARDADVTAAANEHGMVMFHTGVRLFLH